jgi:hypothetical protein
MRVRLTLLLSICLLVPAVALADGHKAGLSGGGSGGSGASGLFGFHVGFEHKLPGDVDPKNLADYRYWRWSIVYADVSVQFGSHDGQVTNVTAMGGVRYAVTPRHARDKIFAHGLLGISNTNHQNVGAGNDFVYAFGAGYERFFTQRTPAEVTANQSHQGLGFRTQVDVIIRDNDDLNLGTFTRVSAGLVYRWRVH